MTKFSLGFKNTLGGGKKSDSRTHLWKQVCERSRFIIIALGSKNLELLYNFCFLFKFLSEIGFVDLKSSTITKSKVWLLLYFIFYLLFHFVLKNQI